MTSSILGFVIGLLWLQSQAALPSMELQGALLGGVLLSLVLAWLVRRHRVRRSLLLCLAACLCGALWGTWRAEMRLAEELPAALEGEDVTLTGTISAMPQRTERGWRFEFEVAPSKSGATQVPHRMSLAWYDMGFRDGLDLHVPPLHAGDRWQLTVRLRRPHGNLNPHGFDFEALLFERGLRATGYVRPKGEQRLISTGDSAYFIERSREAVRTKFEQTLGDAPYAGVLIALAIGDQQAVPRSQWDLFSRTGITHLVSISGLHVTLLASLAALLIGALWRRFPRLMLYLPAQRAAVLGGLAAAYAYCLLAGFAVPAQRTLYMLAVVAAALWSRRNPAPHHVLALTLLVVVLLDPWSVMAPGFWLSFGAVALLFFVGNGRVMDGAANLRWLRQWGRAQWAMSLGLLPLLLALFQQFSLISPLANAVAIPLMSLVITPLVLLAAIPGLGFLLYPAHALLAGLMWLMECLAAIPFSAWQQAAVPLPLTILALAGTLWLLLPRGVPARWLGLLPLGALLLWVPARPAIGELKVTTLDVGQGLAVHVQTASHDLLFDTGPAFSDEADSGNRIILPYLRAMGVHAIDMLVVTHADADHSGGAESVVDGIAVKTMLSSIPFENYLAALPVAQQPCKAGERWEWDGVRFEMLHPAAEDYEKEGGKSNDMSCVLRIASPAGSMLLTGDIEARSEAQLLRTSAASLRSDVMLVPHHGSRTSSTPEFVAAVNPQYVIIPVGYRNRFRHPHPMVLARYSDVDVRRTDRDGALTVEYSAKGMAIASARTESRRYWHARSDNELNNKGEQ